MFVLDYHMTWLFLLKLQVHFIHFSLQQAWQTMQTVHYRNITFGGEATVQQMSQSALFVEVRLAFCTHSHCFYCGYHILHSLYTT